MIASPLPHRSLAAALLWGLAPLAVAATCDPFLPTSASYDIERGDTRLGTGHITLRPAQAQGCYILEQTATPHFLLRWLSGPARQTSEFCIQPDDRLRSYSYQQHRSGVGADRENYTLTFDWSQGVVRGGRFGELPLAPTQTDQLLLATRVRQWLCQQSRTPPAAQQDGGAPAPVAQLQLDFVDQRGADSYTVAVRDFQRIRVPAGEYEAVLVERIDADDRISRFWLDPRQHYRLLKAEQKKRDDPVIRLSLNADPTAAQKPHSTPRP